MEDRRCRKVVAMITMTVIILSVSVQNAFAASEKTTDLLLNRVNSIKKTFLAITDTQENQVLKNVISKISGKKEKELTELKSFEDNITFVIKQVPLERVTGANESHRSNLQEVGTNQYDAVMTPSRSVAPEILRDDLDILARIIHAEARGESFEGQVAVGAVVLNRVQHPDFPKSIREVVYQPGQFTAVEDRQIELNPDIRAYEAAQAALEGQDPSNGAIFYYNPEIATDQWIRTRSVIRSIGNHKFCV